MRRFRLSMAAISAGVLVAMGAGQGMGWADEPPTPDPTLMDVLDSVLADNSAAAFVPPPNAADPDA
jgi:hypothetical protein